MNKHFASYDTPTEDIHVSMRDFNRPVSNRYKARSAEVMVFQYLIVHSERSQKT